ncbi:acyl carrier protein [Rickettsiales bacterium]|nr:acyl carrier protein [Rickettsiales bacterium]
MSLDDKSKEKLLDLVTEYTDFDRGKITPETKFIADMGLDSLDIVELIMAIEEKFGVEISDDEAEQIVTVQHAYDVIAAYLEQSG